MTITINIIIRMMITINIIIIMIIAIIIIIITIMIIITTLIKWPGPGAGRPSALAGTPRGPGARRCAPYNNIYIYIYIYI